MQKITEHIYVMEHQPEVDRPWIGYIKGNKEAALIDAGNSKAHAEKIQGKLQGLELAMPEHVLITHSHWDHSYGIVGWNCIVYSGELTYKILEDMQTWQWTMEEFEQHIQTNEIPLFCRPHMLLEYPDLQGIKVCLPDKVISEEETIDLGDVHVKCIPVQSPHVDDSVVYYVPEDQVIFIGDAYCEEVIGEDWIDRPEIRKTFLGRINQFPYRLVVTGHHGVMKREEFLGQFGMVGDLKIQ